MKRLNNIVHKMIPMLNRSLIDNYDYFWETRDQLEDRLYERLEDILWENIYMNINKTARSVIEAQEI